jgi:hypothetical protein
MYKKFSFAGVLSLLMFISCSLMAQTNPADEPVRMADGLRSSGKIYVVVLVIIIILAGVIAYLINLDKKINRLEKNK